MTIFVSSACRIVNFLEPADVRRFITKHHFIISIYFTNNFCVSYKVVQPCSDKQMLSSDFQ